MMRATSLHHGIADVCRYQSHAFVQKGDSAALPAADLYAWELGKFLDETADQRITEPRKSLKALVAPNPGRHEGRVLNEKWLRRYFAQVVALLAGDPRPTDI